jgi:bifunctional DNase/RNase
MVMTTMTDGGFVEMRLRTAVEVTAGQDDPCSVVVLDAVSQDRRLAITIGSVEALTLSASLAGREFARPMSPQFSAGLLHALGGRVRQVRIDRLIPVGAGTAYGATVDVEGTSGIESVDARPSDALNLAALVHAPIFVAPGVLADAESRLEGDSPEAASLRLAVKSWPPPADL